MPTASAGCGVATSTKRTVDSPSAPISSEGGNDKRKIGIGCLPRRQRNLDVRISQRGIAQAGGKPIGRRAFRLLRANAVERRHGECVDRGGRVEGEAAPLDGNDAYTTLAVAWNGGGKETYVPCAAIGLEEQKQVVRYGLTLKLLVAPFPFFEFNSGKRGSVAYRGLRIRGQDRDRFRSSALEADTQ